jgi:hypothetical protein
MLAKSQLQYHQSLRASRHTWSESMASRTIGDLASISVIDFLTVSAGQAASSLIIPQDQSALTLMIGHRFCNNLCFSLAWFRGKAGWIGS